VGWQVYEEETSTLTDVDLMTDICQREGGTRTSDVALGQWQCDERATLHTLDVTSRAAARR
jgi:hypothetical protein